jgi:vitamin B12 transporter
MTSKVKSLISKTPRLVLAISVFFGLAALLSAGEKDVLSIELEPILVTANRLEGAIGDLTDSATVITEDQIQASHFTTVAELLRVVAGVDVTRAGDLGKATTVRLRGSNSNQTLVLIDGVQVNSPTTGAYDFSDLTPDNIERIEILRGAQSILYGSDAIGGIIQIITKRGEGPLELGFSGSGGSFRTFRETFTLSGSRRNFRYSAAASRTDSRGRFTNDGYWNDTFSSRLSGKVGGTGTLDFSLRTTVARREIPIEVFGAQFFDTNSSQKDRSMVLDVTYSSAPCKWWFQQTKLSYVDLRTTFRDPLDPGETGPWVFDVFSRTDARILGIDFQNNLEVNENDTLVVGFESENQRGKNRGAGDEILFNRDYYINSFYVNNRLIFPESLFILGDQIVFNAGARLDDTDAFGAIFNPKLGVAYKLRQGDLKFRFTYGFGFRAPSINELAFPMYGNPGLDPEKSRTYEAGLAARVRPLEGELSATYFFTRFKDLIVADPQTYVAENLARAEAQGVELEYAMEPKKSLYAVATYTYQKTKDLFGGGPLLRRPAHKGSLSADYLFDWGLRVGGRATFTGDSKDLFVLGFGDTNRAWARVDLDATYTVKSRSRGYHIFARVENLLNSDYSEILGFPAPGLAVYAGLRIQLE